MARMGFDPSKESRWPIAFPQPLSAMLIGAFDTPLVCAGVNRRWLNLIIVASDVLLDSRSWEQETSEDDLWYMRQQLVLVQEKLRQIEGCGETPVEPAVTIEENGEGCKRILLDGVPATDWICAAPSPAEPSVGVSGLSYEELESFYMGCINIAAMLKVENGKIYAKDDCCNWVLIGGQDAPFVTTQSAQGDAAATWQGWDSAGKPPLPEQPDVASSIPGYTTLDSLRCAKATALVNVLYSYLDTDAEIMEAADGGDTITELLALAISAFTGISPWVLTQYSASVKSNVATMGMPEYTDEVAAILADSALKAEIICVLTDRVVPPAQIGLLKMNRVTDADITALIDTFIEVAEPSSDFEARTKQVLLYWLATKATEQLDSVECGCEDKLPYGYVPPLGGMTQFVQMVAGGGVGANTWQATGSTTLESINMTAMGNMLAQDAYETIYQGETYEGQPIFYCGFGVLIEKAVGVIIDSMKIDTALEGTFSECKGRIQCFVPGTGWEDAGGSSTNFNTTTTNHVMFSGGTVVPSDATHFRIEAKGRGTDGALEKVTWENIRITGSRDGVGFVDTPLGQ